MLRLEDTEDSGNEFAYYASVDDGHWIVTEEENDTDYYHPTVTQADIDSAPAWVKAIKPVEATDHD
ncbi:hypothetical protein [Lacticaseibacillus pantheris]|uniref:hypothetical protein n=1 Tax=Lacticaseibacillus pantheris TaxID=171523 RepID=UPI002658752D|nr:hypothetical protein [Lacticaseibacillus pantheris]WKF84473.1 hypothetical protein QY874_09290 [Lacticaseibacillus pantheris]